MISDYIWINEINNFNEGKEIIENAFNDYNNTRPHSLSLEQRVKVLLIKQLVGKSNRMFANMLVIFSMISGINLSYKTIERL